MKRLRDERGAADPLLAEAARLVSARAPLAEDPVRRQRVRARMRRRRTAPPGAAWLRAAAVLLLVFSVAAASAMIGHVARTIRARWQEARVALQEEHARKHGHRGTAPAAATAPAEPMPPLAAAPPMAPLAPLAPTPARVRTPAAPRLAPDDETDQTRLVATAVRALRHEHDPARAAALLQRYLERYPDGAAAEDALALALEATIGRDAPRATGFATRYLARYPQGRWSALARRALAP